MAKNTKKKAKFKEVSFTIQKHKFKELLAQILKHNASTKYGATLLNGVKMSVKDNVLTMVATDGNTLLELETDLDDPVKNEAEALLIGVYLEKLALKKDYYLKKRDFMIFDVLEITIKEENTVIKDVRNEITYTIPHYTEIDRYPAYKKLFPDTDKNKDYNKIGVNMALLSKLSALTQRGIPSILYVNKNPLSAIIVKADYDGIKSRAIVMPIRIRE